MSAHSRAQPITIFFPFVHVVVSRANPVPFVLPLRAYFGAMHVGWRGDDDWIYVDSYDTQVGK
jgi:hypothetical protein